MNKPPCGLAAATDKIVLDFEAGGILCDPFKEISDERIAEWQRMRDALPNKQIKDRTQIKLARKARQRNSRRK